MTTGNSARHPLSDAIFDADFIVPIPAAATPRNTPADDFYPPVSVFGSPTPTPTYADPITAYESACPGGLESISRRLAHTVDYEHIREAFVGQFSIAVADVSRELNRWPEHINAVMLWHATSRYIHWLRARPDPVGQGGAAGVALRLYQDAEQYLASERRIRSMMTSAPVLAAVDQLRMFRNRYGHVAFCDAVRQLNNPSLRDRHWDFVTAYSVLPQVVTLIANNGSYGTLYGMISHHSVPPSTRDRILKAFMFSCTCVTDDDWLRRGRDTAWELPHADATTGIPNTETPHEVGRNLVVFDAAPSPAAAATPVSVWPLIARKQENAGQGESISIGRSSEQLLVTAIISSASWQRFIQLLSQCPGITHMKQDFMVCIRMLTANPDPNDAWYYENAGVSVPIWDCFNHPDIVGANLVTIVRDHNLTYTGLAYMAEQLWRRLRETGVLEEGQVMGVLTDELPADDGSHTVEFMRSDFGPMRTIGQPVDITNYPGAATISMDGGASAQPPTPADVLLERGFINLIQGDLAPSWTMLCRFIAQSTNFAHMVEAVIQLFRGLLSANRDIVDQFDYPDLLRLSRIIESPCTAAVFLAVMRHGLSNVFIAERVRSQLVSDAQLQIPAVRPILASIESDEFQRAGRRMAAVYHTCGRAVLDTLLLRVVWDHRAYRSQRQALPMQVLDQIFNPTNDVLACAAVMYDLEHCDALHDSLVEVDHDLVREVMGALVRFAQGQWNNDDIMGTTSPYTSYDQCLSLQSQWCAVFDEPVVLPAEHTGPVFRLDTEQFLGWIEPQQVFPAQGTPGNWFIVAMPTEMQVYVYEELPNGVYTWRRHIPADWYARRSEPLGYQLSSWHQYRGERVYLQEGSGLPEYAADGGRWEIIRTYVRRITEFRVRNGQLLWKYMGREQSPLQLPPMLIGRLRAATGCVRTHILDLVENWSEAKQHVPNHAHRTALITKLCLWFQYQPDEGYQPQALDEGGLRYNIRVATTRVTGEVRLRFEEMGGATVPVSVGAYATVEGVTVASVEGLQAAWDATEPAPPQEGHHAFVDEGEVVMELDIYTLDRIAHRHVPNYDQAAHADQELLHLVAQKLNQSKDGQTPIEAMIASCITELFNQQSAAPAISHQRSLTLPRR